MPLPSSSLWILLRLAPQRPWKGRVTRKGQGFDASRILHFELLIMQDKNGNYVDIHEPIHTWFSLSYASYLVLPRAVLQRMPVGWQMKFVELVNEIEETLDYGDTDYVVTKKGAKGRYNRDPLSDYKYYDRDLIVEKVNVNS